MSLAEILWSAKPLALLDLVNFGMALVLWLVQAIIYPGLAHYGEERLVPWHQHYTRLISIFVVPLMVVQLGILAWAAYAGAGAAVNGMLLMVLLGWGATFKVSVPLHRKISNRQDVAASVQLLVSTNWPRTVLWSGVFLLGLWAD